MDCEIDEAIEHGARNAGGLRGPDGDASVQVPEGDSPHVFLHRLRLAVREFRTR